jgi:iron complex transport system ATP-binding protein
VKTILELRDVGIAYRGVTVLDGVHFTVQRGEIVGLVGPNGAGKTSLLRAMSGVIVPAAGEVRIEGQDIRKIPRASLARRIAVVPQDAGAGFAFTVLEIVLMGRHPHCDGRYFDDHRDIARARRALAQTGALHLARRTADRLSGGERQRVLIARALAQEPGILLLDEPTAHLDLRHQVELAALVRRLSESGTTTVLVSHDLNLASEVCDRILLLAKGRVAACGIPQEVLQPGRIELAYGCPVWVETSPRTGRPHVRVH